MFKKYLGTYNDWVLCLVLIPIINTINYHLTYSSIRWDWYTYTTYTIDTVSGLICWWLIRIIIDYLDRTLPYQNKLAKRLVIQLFATNIVVQAFIIISTELINAFFGDGPLPGKFYSYNLFIFFIWILVINGIYIGIHFYDEWINVQDLREKDKKLRQTGFEVLLGKSVRHIEFEKIAFFYVDDNTTYLRTDNGQNYVIDIPLSKIVPKIPQELFFRINRKYIVNRTFIKGYKKDTNGKLVVDFCGEASSILSQVISRITAPSFKKWFSSAFQKL
ncbi:LytTR family DNA-binding domain-containing protein [uncultured Croceitalea sp.]|uniref:LytR/AlgR family response regulator transcription factor n=1 Tax=uncultured Croceitalea sp. TaxID=1798908 RepID=UPI0033065993